MSSSLCKLQLDKSTTDSTNSSPGLVKKLKLVNSNNSSDQHAKNETMENKLSDTQTREPEAMDVVESSVSILQFYCILEQ